MECDPLDAYKNVFKCMEEGRGIREMRTILK